MGDAVKRLFVFGEGSALPRRRERGKKKTTERWGGEGRKWQRRMVRHPPRRAVDGGIRDGGWACFVCGADERRWLWVWVIPIESKTKKKIKGREAGGGGGSCVLYIRPTKCGSFSSPATSHVTGKGKSGAKGRDEGSALCQEGEGTQESEGGGKKKKAKRERK